MWDDCEVEDGEAAGCDFDSRTVWRVFLAALVVSDKRRCGLCVSMFTVEIPVPVTKGYTLVAFANW